MTQTPAIRLGEALTIGYGKPLAACSEPVDLAPGTHFLLARNGRGKTTLLRTLSGTLPKVAGEFEVDGRVRYLPEDLSFDPELAPAPIIRSLVPRHRRDDAFQFAERIELDVRKPYGKLSTGNRRKVAVVLAEFCSPGSGSEVIFLDEPFSGLDAACREVIEERWQQPDERVLRIVSCHPDYDRMAIASALLINRGEIRHYRGESQSWQDLRSLLN